MEQFIREIKKRCGNSSDMIYRKMTIDKTNIMIIFNEVLTSSDAIHQFILENITYLIDNKINPSSFFSFFLESVPANQVKVISNLDEAIDAIFNGYTIILSETCEMIGVETRANLDRGIPEADSEQTLLGAKDAFCENFNKNLGLIRRRVKTEKLFLEDFILGEKTKTKTGILYIKDVAEESLIDNVREKIKKAKTDSIIDSCYLKELISKDHQNFFPTIMATERPDQVAMALLEGKIVVLADNSPYALIIPCFLIDLFHTADDYYQKPINITFIRIIRFLAFFIAIFTPAYYVAATTHNQAALSLNLLINFASQRQMVPFPALVEAIIMSITFEILRESDTRMPSSMGSAVSILGGLVLGDAAVSAGIVSPIMIIVIAISAISGLLFSSMELISAIRFQRFLLLILAAFFGIYGIFLGTVLFIIELTSLKSFGKPYLTPFAPFVMECQDDAIIKTSKPLSEIDNPYLKKKRRKDG